MRGLLPLGEIRNSKTGAAKASEGVRQTKRGSRRDLRAFIGSLAHMFARKSRVPGIVQRGSETKKKMEHADVRAPIVGQRKKREVRPGARGSSWAERKEGGGERTAGLRPLAQAEVRAVSFSFFFSNFFSVFIFPKVFQ